MGLDRYKTGDLRANKDYLKYLCYGIIAIGALLRITVFLQNNSMYVDEANVARNIFERSYPGLTNPLDYYQYAPPLFLWIIKSCTILFGYSEFAYRLFPLLCGIFSLVLLYAVLKHFETCKSAWYVLLLLAVGPIYVRYASATKQYIPDMLVTLSLIWLALQNSLEMKSGKRLFFIWTIAGSLAIWISMPSVFILAGVGAYYLNNMAKGKDFSKLWFLVIVGFLWVLQFGVYYITILRPEANSAYLQNFHKEFFFYLPVSLNVLHQDFSLLLYFLSSPGGHQVLALVLHGVCIFIAIIYLVSFNTSKLLLIVLPLLFLLLAAALHQYTLIKRVTLFSMPLMLVLIAIGLQQLLSVKFIAVRLTVLAFAVICFINFNALKNFIYPMQEEEMKQSLQFLKQKNIRGDELYVQQLAAPAYIYYTQIHPQKQNWTFQSGGKLFEWYTNIDSLSKTFPKGAAVLYSWDDPATIEGQQTTIRKNLALADSNLVRGGRVYIYR